MKMHRTLPWTTAALVLVAGLVLGVPLPVVPDFEQQAEAIVGAPLTPVSVAGVARRTTRRVVRRATIYVATHVGTGTSGDPYVPTHNLPASALAAGKKAEATNAAATVTLAAAGAGIPWVLGSISWSLSTNPGTAVELTVTVGGTEMLSFDVTQGGPGQLRWERGLRGADNAAMVISLAAGGTGVVGKVNVEAWNEA